MIAGITVYWKKFRAKQRAGEKFSEKLPLNKDDSMAFTLHQIVEATQHFRHQIGSGGSGTVYLGKLPDSKEIAIKMISQDARLSVLFSEVDLVSRVHHKNLVCLLGYCFDKSEQPMVIYEYMSQGSLKDHLYGGLSKLNWKSRLKIAIDVAEALQYLHVCCIPMIIHRDVKTSNILLDSDLNGKLGDFGLSMMTMDRKAPIEDLVKGTAGYLDPEYMSTGQFTQKSDVFSFGAVLLEIICGRRPIDFSLPEEEWIFLVWVRDYMAINETPGKMVKIIDKDMDGNYDMKSITIVAKLALRCLEPTSAWRPSMSEVVGVLKEAFMYEKAFILSACTNNYICASSHLKDYVEINETPEKMVKIVDKEMDGKYEMKSITIVAKLALRCVEHTSSWRPSVSEVVGELKEAFMYDKVKLKEVVVAKHVKIQE